MAVGLLAACTNSNGNSSFKPGSVFAHNSSGELFVIGSGNSYEVDEAGNVTIAYRDGAVTAKTPLTLDTTGSVIGMSINETGFYISENKTVIVYGFGDGKLSPLHVMISDDMGKTWNDYTIDGAKGYDTKFIGFTSEKEGWIVSGGSAGVGQSMNYIYQTSDGGKTWQEIGNANEQYAGQLTGAGFYNKDIGFLGFRYYEDKGPVIYWTKDRGQTWERLAVALPEQYAEYEKTPFSPVFDGKEGRLPIGISKDGNEAQMIYLTSKDGGLSWVYEQGSLKNK
ncbi:WD40/YVTN/BNR-like repeat-containing protein [Paenibacillus sp. NPDC058174]|uniref:WD40/YVTN/BNR-like repeat-containing protein n=1 Tax=Paenibacillus sp. NPDC058174 TaxID=3346366 RepID=UPI0036DF633A